MDFKPNLASRPTIPTNGSSPSLGASLSRCHSGHLQRTWLGNDLGRLLDIEILTHVLLKACSSSPGLISTHLRVLACLSGLCPLHVQRYLHFHLFSGLPRDSSPTSTTYVSTITQLYTSLLHVLVYNILQAQPQTPRTLSYRAV